jgi:hypothetical protein
MAISIAEMGGAGGGRGLYVVTPAELCGTGTRREGEEFNLIGDDKRFGADPCLSVSISSTTTGGKWMPPDVVFLSEP